MARAGPVGILRPNGRDSIFYVGIHWCAECLSGLRHPLVFHASTIYHRRFRVKTFLELYLLCFQTFAGLAAFFSLDPTAALYHDMVMVIQRGGAVTERPQPAGWCPHCGHRLDWELIRRLYHSYRGRRQTPHAGPGRPPTPTPCPQCGAMCPSASEARRHCTGSRGTS